MNLILLLHDDFVLNFNVTWITRAMGLRNLLTRIKAQKKKKKKNNFVNRISIRFGTTRIQRA